jgi:hypothetical protein
MWIQVEIIVQPSPPNLLNQRLLARYTFLLCVKVAIFAENGAKP